MSGTGAACSPRQQHSWDPTHGCAPAVTAERDAVVDHIRRKIAIAQKHDSDGHLVRVLDELAEDVSRGLHL